MTNTHRIKLDDVDLNLSFTAFVKLDEIHLSPGKKHPQFSGDRNYAELKFLGRTTSTGPDYARLFGITDEYAKSSSVSLELEFGDGDIQISDEARENWYIGWVEVYKSVLVKSPEVECALHFRIRVGFEYVDLSPIIGISHYELKIEPSLLSGLDKKYLGYKDDTVLFAYIRSLKISPILSYE